MPFFAIIDRQASRRKELALALQSVGGWKSETYPSEQVYRRSQANVDIVLISSDLSFVNLDKIPRIYFGPNRPLTSLSAPFVVLYPLPACVEKIRHIVETLNLSQG